MTPASSDQHVQALLRAYAGGTPIAPLHREDRPLTIDDAYTIQLAQTDRWISEGRIVRGRKVGLTSAAMQKQLGVSQPDFGVLFADMFLSDGEPIAPRRFIQPRVEPEIAFVLSRPLTGPGITVADVLKSVDYAVASLEIIDSRIENWNISIADTVADNASSGGVVLGSVPRRLFDFDARLAGVIVRKNGEVVDTGVGGAVLGSPINALVWLANTLGAFGATLEPGMVVLPGAMTASVPLAPGDTIRADFAGLGSVTARLPR